LEQANPGIGKHASVWRRPNYSNLKINKDIQPKYWIRFDK